MDTKTMLINYHWETEAVREAENKLYELAGANSEAWELIQTINRNTWEIAWNIGYATGKENWGN